jgi:ABC-2 type transport system permease protein
MSAAPTARTAGGVSSIDAMAAIASVTVRALIGRRRTILTLLIAGAPVLLGLLVRLTNSGARPGSLEPTLEGLLVTTLLPLVALVFGTAALGSELDDGTAIHILTKPIPRWTIILPKLLVAGTITAVMLVASTVLTGLLLGGTGGREISTTLAFAVAIVVGSFVYVAIFLALSAATSRGLIIGLGYSLVWEGLLSGALPGTQLLSVREYVRGIVATLAPSGTLTSVVGSQGFIAALVALVVITALASYRLGVHEVRGPE